MSLFMLSVGCAHMPSGVGGSFGGAFLAQAGDADSGSDVKSGKGEGPGIGQRLLLWIPNRIMDFGDIARAGVMVGPGLGIDAQLTKTARMAMISDSSVGVGFQTFRHIPFAARTHTKTGIGPIAADPGINLLDWERNFWDAGLEVHALIIGAHVFVNPWQMVDLLAGLVLLDPAGDDLQFDL